MLWDIVAPLRAQQVGLIRTEEALFFLKYCVNRMRKSILDFSEKTPLSLRRKEKHQIQGYFWYVLLLFVPEESKFRKKSLLLMKKARYDKSIANFENFSVFHIN